MRGLLPGIVAAACLAAVPAWAHAPAGPVVRLPAPRPTTGPDGAPALVLELGRGARVVDLATTSEEPDAGRLELRVGDRVQATWPIPWGDSSRSLRGFRRGDDLVVAKHLTTSNGMGVQAWHVLAFRLVDGLPAGPPVRFDALDWGPDAVRADGDGLAVLATDWISPRFGTAARSLHFGGAWFAIDDGRLVPRGGWLTRPYLFSFERERGSAEDGYHPARWLRPGKGKPYAGGDPRLGPETAPRVTGRLALDAEGRLTLGGKVLWLGFADAPAGQVRVAHVAQGGMLWPPGYMPADVGAWRGRAAVLRTYGDLVVLGL